MAAVPMKSSFNSLSTAMAQGSSSVYELGVPDHCIPISGHYEFDEADPYQMYLSVPIAHLNQQELQRLYLAHPWVWFERACSTADALRVAAYWDHEVFDSDCDEYDYNYLEPDYIVVGAKEQLHWIRDHEYNQLHEPDNESYFKGIELIRVTVDKENRRLVLDNFLPYWKGENTKRRRKKRKSTVKIPGIKML